MINKNSLADRIVRISREKNVDASVLYARFFFDSFLSRLSASPYRNNFVLKGGLLLSSLLGVENRSTMDMDFLLEKAKLSRDEVIKRIKQIIVIDRGDGVTFSYLSCERIRPEDIYGGFSLHLEGRLSNIRMNFSLDVAMGDPIVPGASDYDYRSILRQENFPLKAYSFESVIAEKLETILERGLTNSRSKDFYDLYLLTATNDELWGSPQLLPAFRETCAHRSYHQTKEENRKRMEDIRHSQPMRKRFDNFLSKKKYPIRVSFDAVIDQIEKLIDTLG